MVAIAEPGAERQEGGSRSLPDQLLRVAAGLLSGVGPLGALLGASASSSGRQGAQALNSIAFSDASEWKQRIITGAGIATTIAAAAAASAAVVGSSLRPQVCVRGASPLSLSVARARGARARGASAAAPAI